MQKPSQDSSARDVSRAAAATSCRDPALDGLRGFAVLMIYVFHYGGGLRSPHGLVRLLGYATEAGWIGVVLFFALSGFLITGILWDSLADPHWLRNFYARRALRILPLYYLAIVAAGLFALLAGARGPNLLPFGFYALFLQNIPRLAATALQSPGPLPLFHLWSLAVEEQFYLLWPAVLLLAFRSSDNPAKRTRRALSLSLWAFVFSIAFTTVIYALPFFTSSVSDHRFDSFLLTRSGALALGAALALAFRGPQWATVQRATTAALLAGILGYLLVSWRCGSLYLETPLQFTAGLAAVSIACAALIPLVLRPGALRSLSSLQPLAALGRISYGFYVFHILLRPLFDSLGATISHANAGTAYQTARFLVGLPITLLVAWLSFKFLEQPILHRKRRVPMRQPVAR